MMDLGRFWRRLRSLIWSPEFWQCPKDMIQKTEYFLLQKSPFFGTSERYDGSREILAEAEISGLGFRISTMPEGYDPKHGYFGGGGDRWPGVQNYATSAISESAGFISWLDHRLRRSLIWCPEFCQFPHAMIQKTEYFLLQK